MSTFLPRKKKMNEYLDTLVSLNNRDHSPYCSINDARQNKVMNPFMVIIVFPVLVIFTPVDSK